MEEKPDCYKCTYRGGVPGDTHSCCNHPAFKKVKDNPMLSLLGMAGAPIQIKSKICAVEGAEHGIRMGWFCHPFNFDPAWLVSCTGFKKEDQGG